MPEVRKSSSQSEETTRRLKKKGEVGITKCWIAIAEVHPREGDGERRVRPSHSSQQARTDSRTKGSIGRGVP